MAAFCEQLVRHEGLKDVTGFRGDIFGTDGGQRENMIGR